MRNEISGIILVLALSAIILGTSFASSSLIQTQTVASYGQVINFNYTVWTEGGVYYVQDASGTIDYSNPVASNVLNYASATLTTGGSIFVKNGFYQTTTWNIANPNIAVYGESWNTIISARDSDMDSPIILITGDNCSINNIAVYGNLPYQSSPVTDVGILIYGSYSTLEHVYVYNTYDDTIRIQNGASHCTVDNCLITGSNASGIVIYGNIVDGQRAQKCTVSNSTVLNSRLDGVLLSGCDYCVVNNTLIVGAGDCAFEIQGGGVMGHSATGNMATNIHISNSFNPGIYIDGTSTYPVFNTVISNFEVYNCTGRFGVGVNLCGYVQDSVVENGTIQNTVVQGIYVYNRCVRNIIRNITISTTGSSGVKIDTACANNTLDNVTITSAGIYGIQVDAGCTNNFVENSRVLSSTNVGVAIWADSSTVENTLVDDPNATGICLIACNYCTISGNRIYDPNGDGININAGTGNTISSNYIFNFPGGYYGIRGTGAYCVNDLIIGNYINCTTASGRTGIALWSSSNGATDNRISQNTICNTATGINVMAAGVNGTILANNQLVTCSTPITDSGVGTAIYNNTGYNPVGIINNSFAGNNHILLDLGGDNGTWSSDVIYTNWESPKTLYISAGNVKAVVKNGQTIFSNTDCTVALQPGDTFSITFTLAPTIKVEGQ
jgi:parallel beta-helix repeat protein